MKRKMTRSERRRLIERIKSAVIAVLFVSSAVLAYNIWTTYKGQATMGKAFWQADNSWTASDEENQDVTQLFADYTEPEFMMVGEANTRVILEKDDADYQAVLETVRAVVQDLYSKSAENFEEADAELWKTAISEGTAYVRFPALIYTDFEASFFAAEESGFANTVECYSEIMIIPYDAMDSGATVLVKSESDRRILRVAATPSMLGLKGVIAKKAEETGGLYMFAHELKLDHSSVGEGTVALDSMFLIPFDEVRAENIIVSVPGMYRNGLEFGHTADFTANLISIFGYNPNTIRQYANSNNELIFVGETGSLGIHPGGEIEYKALGENEGIPIYTSEDALVDSKTVVSAISGMTRRIFSACGVSTEYNSGKLRITGMPDMNDGAEIRVRMDYFVDNTRVSLADGPAFEAVIRNGVIVEMRMWVKSIVKSEKTSACQTMFEAIDAFCAENPECKSLKGADLIYRPTEDEKETSVVWEIQGV